MSLREEIATLMCERYCGIGVMSLPEFYPADVEIADELVNKILDAAIEAVDESFTEYDQITGRPILVFEVAMAALEALKEGK